MCFVSLDDLVLFLRVLKSQYFIFKPTLTNSMRVLTFLKLIFMMACCAYYETIHFVYINAGRIFGWSMLIL